MGSFKASIVLHYSAYHRARYLENAQDYFIYKVHKEAWWKINIVLGFPWRSPASVKGFQACGSEWFLSAGQDSEAAISWLYMLSFIYIEFFTFSLKLTFSQHSCTSHYPFVTAISCDLFGIHSLLLVESRERENPHKFPIISFSLLLWEKICHSSV